MELKDLMAGIAVVIDDAFEQNARERGAEDPILRIVRQIEQKWHLPFYTASAMPPETAWPGLFQAASFILLDWRLWPSGAPELERAGVEQNNRFLSAARDYFIPVLIFTNENPSDVAAALPESVYHEDSADQSFVFLRNKDSLLADGGLDFGAVEQWVRANASVYALKTWQQALRDATRELFGSMYARSSDWPRVFWRAYEDDGVDPSSSLTRLISDSLLGRIRASAFESEILGRRPTGVRPEDLRALIRETSFRPQRTLPDNEIRCGDVFRQPRGRFLLNLRPDCDCVPRNGTELSDIELYCVEGKRVGDTDLRKRYHNGHFNERVWECVSFAVCDERSLRFDFRKFHLRKFSDVREHRLGRLLHPYLTAIQQRFALYLQRQGLPPIPEDAIPRPTAPGAQTGAVGR